jgi:SAM-dependent methyltransferase
MRLTIDIAGAAESETIRSLDLSIFGPDDLLNLILQRSEVMFDIPRSGRIIRAWNSGDEGPIREVVTKMGIEVARRAAAVIHAEYQSLAPALKAGKPKRIADIGCGYGLFDLFAARDSTASVVLIDIEQNARRHFGFAEEGAAYSNLATARRLLQVNGIASTRIETLNPQSADLTALKPVDIALSFLSCGFHYPVSAYAGFFTTQVKPKGVIMLDVREASAGEQIPFLESLGTLTDLPSPPKARRVAVTKAAKTAAPKR